MISQKLKALMQVRKHQSYNPHKKEEAACKRHIFTIKTPNIGKKLENYQTKK